jgi:hypothetical protein
MYCLAFSISTFQSEITMQVVQKSPLSILNFIGGKRLFHTPSHPCSSMFICGSYSVPRGREPKRQNKKVPNEILSRSRGWISEHAFVCAKGRIHPPNESLLDN